tara:strand:- start:115 stop:297 length:183 start_codon:yes stop_codon:yes gene_type:complete
MLILEALNFLGNAQVTFKVVSRVEVLFFSLVFLMHLVDCSKYLQGYWVSGSALHAEAVLL